MCDAGAGAAPEGQTLPGLTEFLLARIAEDEGRAPKHHHAMCEWMMRGDRGATEEDCDCGLEARRKFHLAECEAKRRILAHHQDAGIHRYEEQCQACDAGYCSGACPTMRALALPYADHSDYRQEWRP